MNTCPVRDWHQAAIYEIYVRSFHDAEATASATCPGVLAKLGHVADLGADAIWPTPIHPSLTSTPPTTPPSTRGSARSRTSTASSPPRTSASSPSLRGRADCPGRSCSPAAARRPRTA